jgi:calcineurin-like phosphoesterase
MIPSDRGMNLPSKRGGRADSLVDFHAEVTDEKEALGFLPTGKVSAVVGNHFPRADDDAKILPVIRPT